MSNNKEPEVINVNLEDLAQYLLLGVDKEGKPVSISAGKLSIYDTEALLARAKAALDVQKVAAGLDMYRQHQLANASPILRPGMQ